MVEDEVVVVVSIRATISLREVLGYFNLFKHFWEDTIREVQDTMWVLFRPIFIIA